ncbi:nucleobase-ascorbate transporter 12-like [Prosopis cineraria]|uniref:nucleobase-ascorbate transporter 12-like n=1 Tax=Prosopis cineraria TaxID=364024 RepID=UPI00240F9DDA|nr:nucleobase-ascorbate transporter 12-like [Prosopis cineraria]
MLTALGLSNLRYSEAGSSRNIIIVGLSLFFLFPSLPTSSNMAYLPFQLVCAKLFSTLRCGFSWAFPHQIWRVQLCPEYTLCITHGGSICCSCCPGQYVPGSKQERGVYVWSEAEAARREPAVMKDYELPFRVGREFSRWVKCVGL